MRPVTRGSVPEDDDGREIVFTEYQQARGELIKRIGEYCSYCEMELGASLAVEHVQPKKPEGISANLIDRELNWDNFLLACSNCNSTKGNEDVDLLDYLWPDRDNTSWALQYAEGGVVSVAEHITDPELKGKARAIIELVGLDKTPNDEDEASDRRWLNRKEAWEIACRSKERLSRNYNQDFKEQVVETAYTNGFWSVWLTVFSDDPDMRRRLIEAFPGTCSECFDSMNNHEHVARPQGQC